MNKIKRNNKDMKNKMSKLDHLVIASPDLEALVDEFHRLTGLEPKLGGRHEGRGTANYLVGLGEESYIELIGPDLGQDKPSQGRPLRVDEVSGTRLVGWSVRPDDINYRVSKARELGYDPGQPEEMSRKTPEGDLLEWMVTPLNGGLGGTIPFLIDWKKSKHPSEGLEKLRLVSLELRHPEPKKVKAALEAIKALELVSKISKGDIGLSIELDSPKGRVRFD